AAGHALLLCGQRHAAVALALEVMGREVDRVLDATKATLESLRANRSYDATVLADCMPPIATELMSHAAAAVTSCFWLAAQMVLTPLVVHVHMTPPAPPPPNHTPGDTQHHPGPPELIASSGAQGAAAAGIAQGLSSSNGSGSSSSSSSSGSCYSSSLHVSSCVTFTIVTTGNLRVGGPVLVPAAAAAAAPTIRPGEPSLAPLNQPLLTTWQPRRAVLYLDITRLNATNAAAVATAPGSDPQAASPPPAAMDTAALPHLPAALELLGWTLRHAEEFYHGHFAAGPPNESGPALTAAAAPPTKAPSAAPSTASTPRGSAVLPGGTGPSRRGSASVAGSVSVAENVPPPPTAALATDPLTALSEAKLAAHMAEEADVAVLAGGRLADAGSLIKWLSQNGMLVLVAADLQQLPEALAGTTGGSSGDNNDNDNTAARALARTLVGLLATHHLQAATVRTLMQPLSHGAAQPASAATPRPGTRSSASTPRTSLSGKPGPPMTPVPPASTTLSAAAAPGTAASAAASGLQPLAVLTHLPDLALAKPALAICNELARRVDLALQALEAAFAAAPPLAPHAAMLARHVSRQLAQQRLLLEGLLLAPELLRARHPGTVPLPGSVAAAATAAAGRGSTPWQPWGRLGDVAATPPLPPVGMSQASPPAPSRQSSLGRMRPSLPAMTPKSSVSRRTSMAGGATATAVTPPWSPSVHPAPPPPPPPPSVPVGTTDAYSTESEDEEVGVSKLAPVPRAASSGVGLSGAMSYGGGAPVLVPDEPDADSDAASIASASTLGSLVSRGRIPR
ncbi:hypothetical protein VaNZ11_000605, partial [Volvox africanus]